MAGNMQKQVQIPDFPLGVGDLSQGLLCGIFAVVPNWVFGVALVGSKS